MRCELIGIGERPGLIAALAGRGIVPGGQASMTIMAWPGRAAPPSERPTLAVVRDAGEVIVALDAGFADAVADSESDALIAARAAAILRRRATMAITVGALVLDPVARSASRAGRMLALRSREYALLLHLARHAGDVMSRAALRIALWGRPADPGTNVLEVHISRLRQQLDRGFARPMLLTEKGVGYRLVA